MLTSGELTWMRAQQDRAHPGTAIIQRYTLAADGMGGQTETWAAVGTATCRAMPMNMRGRGEILTGDQINAVARWDITLPNGTDVTASDRITIGGRIFEIQRVNNDQGWQTAVRVEAITYNEFSA